jgi:hypothetical protein
MLTRLDSFSFQQEEDALLGGTTKRERAKMFAERPRSAGQQSKPPYGSHEIPKRIALLSTQYSSQSLAQEIERPLAIRKKTRAVFSDLHTAHTKITGHATSRYQGLPKDVPAFNEDESSIALTELSPFDDSSSSLLPVHPRPVVVPSLRRSRTTDNDLLPEPKRRSRQSSYFEKRSGSGTSSIAHDVSFRQVSPQKKATTDN